MSISLNELTDRLAADVAARDSIPSAEQYRRLVIAAVTDFGQRAGRYKIATLSIVSGTATYALPTDFVRLTQLESLQYPDNLMITGAGLTPLPQSFQERHTIAGGQITFYPTPSYSITRYLHYQAGWVLDAGDNYDELEEGHAEILLQHAASKALTLQANHYAAQAWQYQVGDERVSKEKLAEALRAQSKAVNEAYVAAITTYNSSYGSRASYPEGSYS